MAYVVNSMGPVTHDGTTYAEGQEIPSLEKKQAESLLLAGVIDEVQPSKGSKG